MKSLHIIFGDGSNPYVRFNMDEHTFRNELCKWKRHYNIVHGYWNGDILNISVSHKTPMQEAEMRKTNKEYYNRMKRRARDTALCWQEEFANKSMSWDELAEAQSYFEKLGKKYGLLVEFRANGIC